MKIEEIEKKIENLIKEGKKEFKTRKKTKYYIDSEYCIVYAKAVSFLLESYNKQTAGKIDTIFDEKIPKLFDNKECKNVLIESENLKNTDIKIRKKAIKFFRSKALGESLGFRAMIFERPETFKYLLSALKKEEDEKNIENLIIAIGGAYERYALKYFEVPDVLYSFLNHKKADIRYYSVIWTRQMKIKERLDILQDMQRIEKSKKVKEVLKKYIEICKEDLK